MLTPLFFSLLIYCTMACSASQEDFSNQAASTNQDAKVELIPNKNSYAAKERIEIRVNNSLKRPITAMDQQSYCSIITLEKQQENTWQAIRNCTFNSPALEVTIEAGKSKILELNLHQQTAESLPAGTYRATLVYSVGEHYKISQTTKATSDPFTVQ